MSAVQLPPDTKAINTPVRLGLVTELYGKFATNHKRSLSSVHMKRINELGGGQKPEQFQRAKNDYLNIKNQEKHVLQIKNPT